MALTRRLKLQHDSLNACNLCVYGFLYFKRYHNRRLYFILRSATIVQLFVGNIKCCGCLPRLELLSYTFFFKFLQKQNVKTSLVLHFCNPEGRQIQTSANRGKYSDTFVACFKVMFLVSIEIPLILGWVELRVIFIVQLCCVLIGQSMSLVK